MKSFRILTPYETELADALFPLREQVDDLPPAGVCQGVEHRIHSRIYTWF